MQLNRLEITKVLHTWYKYYLMKAFFFLHEGFALKTYSQIKIQVEMRWSSDTRTYVHMCERVYQLMM